MHGRGAFAKREAYHMNVVAELCVQQFAIRNPPKPMRRLEPAPQETAMNDPQSKLSRRRVFAGAGTVGALAAVAAVVPATKPAVGESAEKRADVDQPSGYRLTEHVRRYYQTTKV